ncbi:extracellular solute-binding protein [Actinobacteria bacterium YIM 96077]|uniref:HTH gntR-type domain-containing protein n=1 Tax=Phytoactinopolyspora halophila TaxID=1981511 RepID=A0A329QRD4_9ACTN|nr:extracellular solute-binding protein [Phytoactinopolyspora halophila]AYY14221.1 extracellular solute-binding protein [Actinobacteria bacterium YIM 96077]RAW14763.1 hypothetical protein DPM12_09700 [Phytoactinopolyspora halophila]
MSIDPEQPIPLYFQLKTLLLQSMIRGEYGPGDRLPTEHELCDLYGLSRTPVSRALSELADEGVVLRHRRRGSFVNPHWAPRRGTELRVVVPAEGPWETLIHKAVPDDLTINVVTVPRADLHRTLTRAVAEAQAPDLAVLDSVWMPEFAAAGFLYALEEVDEDWVTNEYESDFLPPLITANRYAGRTYSVSLSADVAGLWYRRSELHKLRVGPPESWAELRGCGHALREHGIAHPLALPGGSRGDETTTCCLLAFLASNGVEVLGTDGVLVDQPRVVEALEYLRRLVDEGVVPAEAVGFEWNQPVRLLARGQAGMSFGGSYEARTLAESMGIHVEDLGQRIGFLPIPPGPQGAPASLAGTMVCGIFRQTAYPDLALRLLRHLSAAELLAELSVATGCIPPRRSAIELAGSRVPLLPDTVKALEQAVIRPRIPLYPRVSAQLQVMLESVLTGQATPAGAVSRVAELISAITGLPSHHPSPSPSPPHDHEH